MCADPPPPDVDAPFVFRDPGPLADAELTLVLEYRSPANPARGWIPAYHFSLRVDGQRVGGIELRVGHGAALARDAGHLGYFVGPEWRGRGYAARAARLLLPLARAHGFERLWITCDVDNAASRRTCERLGAVLVEVVPRREPGAARGAPARGAAARGGSSRAADAGEPPPRSQCRYCLDLRS